LAYYAGIDDKKKFCWMLMGDLRSNLKVEVKMTWRSMCGVDRNGNGKCNVQRGNHCAMARGPTPGAGNTTTSLELCL
jgi:hypothetical protein